MTINPAESPQDPTPDPPASGSGSSQVANSPWDDAPPSHPSTPPPEAESSALPEPAPQADTTLETEDSPTLGEPGNVMPRAPGLQIPQVQFKSAGTHLELILPTEGEPKLLGHQAISTDVNLTWMEVWQQLKHRLHSGQRLWQPQTDVHLVAQNRLLDGRQLQAISEALASVQLHLVRVKTSRRQTAVVAATAGYSVDQDSHTPTLQLASPKPANTLADPLYIQATLRSGNEVRHPGTVVVFGDVNPGSSIIAHGDILVWGRLRGIAHAGAHGNSQCLIAALQMEPTQLRIAQVVARAPSEVLSNYYPEVAYVTPKGICIMEITEFSKNPFLS